MVIAFIVQPMLLSNGLVRALRSVIAAFAMRVVQASMVAGLASSACSSGGGGGGPGPGTTGTACTQASQCYPGLVSDAGDAGGTIRLEEHTSELQSQSNLVC